MTEPPADASQSMTGGREPAAKPNWRLIGPGIAVAATGVGSGDLVATLIAGSRFGNALFWAVIAGAVVKIALAEATRRWHLAPGRTIFDGWSSLGRWTSVYFGIDVASRTRAEWRNGVVSNGLLALAAALVSTSAISAREIVGMALGYASAARDVIERRAAGRAALVINREYPEAS